MNKDKEVPEDSLFWRKKKPKNVNNLAQKFKQKSNKEDWRKSKGTKTVPQEWAWLSRIKRRRENLP